jgi:hypothetical protein
MSVTNISNRQRTAMGTMSTQTKQLLTDNTLSEESVRDDRFKNILRENLGRSGIAIITSMSFLFVIVIIMIATGFIGFVSSIYQYNKTSQSTTGLIL